MNLTLSHEAHDQKQATHRQSAKKRTQLREGADAMLRDIAFVLKMTQKLRDEIETAQRRDELALAGRIGAPVGGRGSGSRSGVAYRKPFPVERGGTFEKYVPR